MAIVGNAFRDRAAREAAERRLDRTDPTWRLRGAVETARANLRQNEDGFASMIENAPTDQRESLRAVADGILADNRVKIAEAEARLTASRRGGVHIRVQTGATAR